MPTFVLDADEQRAVQSMLAEIARRGYDLTPAQQQLADRLAEEEIARAQIDDARRHRYYDEQAGAWLDESPLDALAICLSCYRDRFGLDVRLPPPPLPRTTERCRVCDKPTTAGLYLLRGES